MELLTVNRTTKIFLQVAQLGQLGDREAGMKRQRIEQAAQQGRRNDLLKPWLGKGHQARPALGVFQRRALHGIGQEEAFERSRLRRQVMKGIRTLGAHEAIWVVFARQEKEGNRHRVGNVGQANLQGARRSPPAGVIPVETEGIRI